MSIKIVLFPLSVVIALVAGIFWIYPEYQSIVDKQIGKQIVLEQEQEKLLQIQERSANITALKQDMEGNAGSVDAVFDYLPADTEEENVVRSLESLVQDSGAALVGIDVVETKLPSKKNAFARSDAVTDDQEGGASHLDKVPAVFQLSMAGSYEAVRAFVGNVERFYRDTNVQSLAIVKNVDTESPDTLSATLEVGFNYAPIAKLGELEPSPVFKQTMYDFSVIDGYRARFSRPYIAATVSRASGRTNPFVP